MCYIYISEFMLLLVREVSYLDFPLLLFVYIIPYKCKSIFMHACCFKDYNHFMPCIYPFNQYCIIQLQIESLIIMYPHFIHIYSLCKGACCYLYIQILSFTQQTCVIQPIIHSAFPGHNIVIVKIIMCVFVCLGKPGIIACYYHIVLCDVP